MQGEVWPNRNVMHKWMGPEDSCDVCYGLGRTWATTPGTENDYIPDDYEVYCSCPCGQERKRLESG